MYIYIYIYIYTNVCLYAPQWGWPALFLSVARSPGAHCFCGSICPRTNSVCWPVARRGVTCRFALEVGTFSPQWVCVTGGGPETGFKGSENRGLIIVGEEPTKPTAFTAYEHFIVLGGGISSRRLLCQYSVCLDSPVAAAGCAPLLIHGRYGCRPRAYGHPRTMEIGVSAGESALRPWIPT